MNKLPGTDHWFDDETTESIPLNGHSILVTRLGNFIHNYRIESSTGGTHAKKQITEKEAYEIVAQSIAEMHSPDYLHSYMKELATRLPMECEAADRFVRDLLRVYFPIHYEV